MGAIGLGSRWRVAQSDGIVRAMYRLTLVATSVMLVGLIGCSAQSHVAVPTTSVATALPTAPGGHRRELAPERTETRKAEASSLDDGYDFPAEAPAPEPSEPSAEHPLAQLSEDAVRALVRESPVELGSMSIGRPSGGALYNGVAMPDGDHWTVVDPHGAWGTQETVDYLARAIDAVYAKYPSDEKLSIGHLSDENGGHLSPHLSHQAGRDVDISYFYLDGAEWYRRATQKNLDVERTWAFVRALVTLTDVELLLIDYSIQRLLRDYAESIGEDGDWLQGLFKGKNGQRALIRHARGHATHMHIRFFNPVAQETARRCVPMLIEEGVIKAPTYYVQHRARRGDTLGRIAKRYGTTVRAIQRANGLRSSLIQAKRVYKIPQSGPAPQPSAPTTIPPRRLPP